MKGRDGDRRPRPVRRRGNVRALAWPALALAVSGSFVIAASSQGGPATKATGEINSAAAGTSPRGVAPASAGRWTVYPGDTLRSLAKGIHPRNRARQAQYIAAVRSLNPDVANLAEDAPMPVALQLVLPDLKALSGLAPNVISFPASTSPPHASLPPVPSAPPPSPAPAVRAPGEPTAEAARPAAPAAVPGQWTVRAGDTMRKLASAIYPRSRARQDLYIAELRALNASLATIGDDVPLEENAQLGMPDLKKLSALPVTAATPSAKPEKRAARTPAPLKLPPAKPAPPREETPKAAGGSATPKPERPAPTTAPVSKTPADAGFRLKLSGADIDLTRSRNVSENDRRALREKQLLLDADDRQAALLSLRNTVRQLEARVSELQLKLASATSAPATGKPAAPVAPPAQTAPVPRAEVAPPPPVASPAGTPAIAPAAAPAPTPATPPAAASAPVASPTDSAAPAAAPVPTVKSPAPTQTQTPDKVANADSDWISMLGSTPVLAGIAAVAVALVGLLFWSRRRPTPSRKGNGLASPSFDKPADHAQHEETAALRAEPDLRRAAVREPSPVRKPDAAPVHQAPAFAAPAPVRDSTDQQSFDVTLKLDSPLNVDDSPARFDLDVSPATQVDFPVGLDDKPGEDRVRRLQYMYERYPELMTHTVSIDDADSVINAARLYYEEDHRDKACELLTFGVEERPQETRFWLAQFEIFRLENMVAEFVELASKFHVLFGNSPAWPKVRHIGHELDPTNTLFAAAGRDALAGEMHFDPVAENWLNAPMDFTSDALTSDLRLALFDDHGVDRPDFESITARLAAGAIPAR